MNFANFHPLGADLLTTLVFLPALGALVLVVSVWCVVTDMGLTVLHQVRVTLYALFFGCVVLVSIQPGLGRVSAVFQNGALRFLGKYSYGLYVYHAMLLWYAMEHGVEARVDALLGNHTLTMIVDAVVGSALSIAVALLSYHLIERHLLGLKRYFETVAAPGRSNGRGETAMTSR